MYSSPDEKQDISIHAGENRDRERGEKMGKKTRSGGDHRATDFDLQQAFPIWTPACPTWREMTSRILVKKQKRKNSEKGLEDGDGILGELADRELKDVDERDDGRHEETSPRG